MSDPLVSVLMPVFNRARFIAPAIRSILGQSLGDFELLVVDDGSTDQTAGIVESFSDQRIRLVRHETNLGIPVARNRALEEARGKYVAWLDSDDLARRRRLESQVRHLEANPQTAVVGGCAGKLGPSGKPMPGVRVPPLSYEDIRAWLLFRSPFQQSTVTGRTEILKAHPFRADYPVCEDFDQFVRLAKQHRVENLPMVVVDRRLHPGQTVETRRGAIDRLKAEIIRPGLELLIGAMSPADLRRHVALGAVASKADLSGEALLDWADPWLERMAEANSEMRLFDQSALLFTIACFWSKACTSAGKETGSVRAAVRRLCSRHSAGWSSRNSLVWLTRAAPLKSSAILSRPTRSPWKSDVGC